MPAMVPVGSPSSCTATVTDSTPTSASAPSGTVSFTADVSSSAFASCTLGGIRTEPRTETVNISLAARYIQKEVGPHTITASYGGDASHLGSSAAFVVTALKHETSTEVSCSPAVVPVGSPTSCTATVTDSTPTSASAPSGTVSFSADLASSAFASCTLGGASTDPLTGAVSTSCAVSYTSTVAGPHTITASYSGDATHLASTDITTVTVTPGQPAFVTLDPATGTDAVGTQHCVTATVTDAFGNPIPGITVRFSVTGVNRASGSGTTNDDGQTTFCYKGLLFGVDTIRAFADTNNNGMQDAGEPFAEATETWLVPVSTPGCDVTITNGGWIIADNGDKATFGGVAHVPEAGPPYGQEAYSDHGPAVKVNGNAVNILVGVCNNDLPLADIYGKATIDGAGSFIFRIEVQDLHALGLTDTYWLLLSNGYDSGSHALGGGNVQIHKS